LASSSTRFAFASTLAIYVYHSRNFQLEKVFTLADQNISAIEWDPLERYIAQATLDKKFIVWEVVSESMKFQATLPSSVI
jgi:WD40 repeat protein